jgi:hypothetical protein
VNEEDKQSTVSRDSPAVCQCVCAAADSGALLPFTRNLSQHSKLSRQESDKQNGNIESPSINH